MNYIATEIDPTDGGLSKYRARIVAQDRRFCEAVRRAYFGPHRIERAPVAMLPPPAPMIDEPLEADADAVVIPGPRAPDWRRILAETAVAHSVTVEDIISARKTRAILPARFEAIWRMRHETDMSLSAIGRRMGGRDHTTIISALRRYEASTRKVAQ